MAQSLPISHSRKSKRVASNEDAIILLADGRTREPCKIIDRSEGGVQLSVKRSVDLPEEFRLVAGQPETHAICRIAWRVGSRVGCAFIAQFRDHDPNSDTADVPEPECDKKAIKSRLLKRPLIID